jgi:predicted nucleotidyltransferase
LEDTGLGIVFDRRRRAVHVRDVVVISLQKRLAEICRAHGLVLVYFFGARASDGLTLLHGGAVSDGDPLSDLDVGVVTAEPLPAPSERAALYAAVHNDLQDILVPLRLDLSLLEENHSVFQLEAVKGICVYAKDEQTREDYEMNILRRAADFRPILEAFLREVLEEA